MYCIGPLGKTIEDENRKKIIHNVIFNIIYLTIIRGVKVLS